MARLPEPQVEGLETTWGQGYKELQDCFFNVIGQAIRKRSKAETESRIKLEEQLRGKRDKLKPPTNITKGAKKYFKMIVDLD